MEPKLKVMYFPAGTSSIIQGFSTHKSENCICISITDPEHSDIDRDVSSVVTVDLEDPNDQRFVRCMAHAKKNVSDAQWDALRRESLQTYLVPPRFVKTSRIINKIMKKYEIC